MNYKGTPLTKENCKRALKELCRGCIGTCDGFTENCFSYTMFEKLINEYFKNKKKE